MRYFIAFISILLVLTSFACSRELRSGDDTPQRPFNFDRIPVDDQPSEFYTSDGSQESAGQTEVVDDDATPVETPVADDPALTALINEGRNAIMNNDWEGAIETFLQVVERDENNTIALYNLGLSYRLSGNIEKAVEYASRAVDSDPDRLFVHQNLAKAYLASGDVESAMMSFEEELDRHPNETAVAEVAFDLARLKLDNGLNEEAFDAALKAVQLGPDQPTYHAILGEVHLSNGAYEQALEQFLKSVELASDQPIYRKLVGDALWESGQEDEARDMYLDAVALDESIREIIPEDRLVDNSDGDSLDSPM